MALKAAAHVPQANVGGIEGRKYGHNVRGHDRGYDSVRAPPFFSSLSEQLRRQRLRGSTGSCADHH